MFRDRLVITRAASNAQLSTQGLLRPISAGDYPYPFKLIRPVLRSEDLRSPTLFNKACSEGTSGLIRRAPENKAVLNPFSKFIGWIEQSSVFHRLDRAELCVDD